MSDLILNGDCIRQLKRLPEKCVQTCVTSPPYFGLRDYGVEGQLGIEETPEEYVNKMVEVFREVRRVLKDDGTLWLNLGDSYAGSGKGAYKDGIVRLSDKSKKQKTSLGTMQGTFKKAKIELPAKNLIGIPWRVAFALQADGWILRQDIIWNKPNVMPESVKDRCVKSHEYIFLLSKSKKYYFDYVSVKEPLSENSDVAYRNKLRKNKKYDSKDPYKNNFPSSFDESSRSCRSVWSVNTKPFKGAHFATFPEDLIKPCVLAGSKMGDIVLDPFLGSGTTGVVAKKSGRKIIGIELNKEYADMAKKRISECGL